jgi:L-glutamine-phosphate cytidylyltransferase
VRAVILAAGRGSRLGAATVDRPKCLVHIEGRTLLDRQLRALRQAGAGEIGIVTGWRAAAFAGVRATFFHNPRWADTTMVGSLAAAGAWLDEGPVLVSYGDIVYPPDAVRRLAAATAPLAIAYDPDWRTLWTRRFADPLGDAETFVLGPTGDLLDIGGRPADLGEVQGQYMGLLRFTPAAWSVVRQARSASRRVADLDMTGMLRHLVRGRLLRVEAVAVAGPWCEFDHPADVEVGRDVLKALDRQLAAR